MNEIKLGLISWICNLSDEKIIRKLQKLYEADMKVKDTKKVKGDSSDKKKKR